MNVRAVLAPVAVLVGGLAVAVLLIRTGPKVEPRAPDVAPPLVRVLEVSHETVQLRVSAHGTVAPRTESELVPEVSGAVTWVSPALVSGGFFTKADVLLKIDPLDYEAALEERRANLERVRSELGTAWKEHGRQLDLARRQVSSDARRDDAVNRFTVAKAMLREASAQLERAERDLARTELRAPYDGRVRSERVDVGQFVNRGASVATIYAVDFAEVRLPVADEELAYLDLPLVYRGPDDTARAPVILRARFAGREHEWRGEVVRTEGELDPRTRMVNVVARVRDPYAEVNGTPPLAVGLFVEAEILGPEVENVVVLPRSALRGGGRVLIVDHEQRLRFRNVDILRLAGDEVFVRGGLTPGERVCVSPLEAPIEGMEVRVSKPEAASAASGPREARS